MRHVCPGWLLAVAFGLGCTGRTVDPPADEGTGSTVEGTGRDATGNEASGSSGSDSAWPRCVQPTIGGVYLSLRDAIADADVAIDATCTLAGITIASDETVVDTSDCVDGSGDTPSIELDLRIYSGEPIAVPITPGSTVDVSFVSSRFDEANDNIWYSLREPEGRLLLAAFGQFETRVEPNVEGVAAPEWLAPFAVELGEFVCAPDPGCESPDDPQRAVARFSDGASTIDVVDGTAARLGDHVLSLGYAREPDHCEGPAASYRLGGVIVLDP